MTPFSKLTGWIFSFLAIVQGMSHDQIVTWLTTHLSFVNLSAGTWGVLAYIVAALSVAVPLFSHSATGTGGASSPNAATGLTANLVKP